MVEGWKSKKKSGTVESTVPLTTALYLSMNQNDLNPRHLDARRPGLGPRTGPWAKR